jgi:hypothetical protein
MNRGAILRGGPSAVGAAWVRSLCGALSEQGRPVAGGWPGTMVEARALIVRHLQLELEGRGMRSASSAELASAATATYEHARSEWLGIERRARALLRHRA